MNMISIQDRRIGHDRRAPAVVPSDILWSCDFSQPIASYGFAEQSFVTPGRATLVLPARTTGKSVRLHTEPGDSNVAGSGTWERDDLQSNQTCVEGQDEWWAHSVMFPADYVDPPTSTATAWNGGVVFDFHDSAIGNWQANFMVMAMPVNAGSPGWPTGLSFQMSSGTQAASVAQNYPIGPVTRLVWYDFVYHAKWSATAGTFDAWVNGVHRMAYVGPTLYPSQSVYMKLACYRSPDGKASSVLHSRIIRGKTAQSVALTALGA